MTTSRRIPPVWLMGLANMSQGLYVGVFSYAIPQVLAARNVPLERIAAVTAVAMFPNFSAFVFGPMLDVWFSRRKWATILAATVSISTILAILGLDHIGILEASLFVASTASMLTSTALGGWLSTVCPKEQENKLSAWYNIANVATTGITAVIGGALILHLPIWSSAGILGGIIFAPTALFLLIPCSPPDSRLAGESFAQFNRELLMLLKKREVLLALLLFMLPCGSFTLTNMFAALGKDFHASAQIVSLSGGAGVVIPGVLGSLIAPYLARLMPLRYLYIVNGVAGAIFTLLLVVLPHEPWSFVLAVMGEFMFMAISYTVVTAIGFEVIGQDNPLAATTFTVLSSSGNIALTYMLLIDGRGYSLRGLSGALGADAVACMIACLIVVIVFARWGGKSPANRTPALAATPQED